jgi:glycosyltransferase involved in cell wall biosynthesis
MTEKNEVVVSFCIPTYNRAEYVRRCILSILNIESEQIEVVVVNNDSQDVTEKIVNSIKDTRISYYKNDKNIGAVLNIIETIKRAKGRWVFLLSDEDIIFKENILKIIKDISNGKYSENSVIFGNLKNPDGSYYQKYSDKKILAGDEAICKIGFSHAYMSGILLNKKLISLLNLNDLNIHNVGVYPHVYIFTYACLFGDVITLNNDVVLMVEPRAEKSYIEKPGGNFYYHPKNRLAQFKIYVKIASDIVKNPQYKTRVLSYLYYKYLYSSTFGWEKVLNDYYCQNHFGVSENSQFNFWLELRNSDSEAKKIFNEIIKESDVRKALINHIFKTNIKFMVYRVFTTITKYILELMKVIKRNLPLKGI